MTDFPLGVKPDLVLLRSHQYSFAFLLIFLSRRPDNLHAWKHAHVDTGSFQESISLRSWPEDKSTINKQCIRTLPSLL